MIAYCLRNEIKRKKGRKESPLPPSWLICGETDTASGRWRRDSGREGEQHRKRHPRVRSGLVWACGPAALPWLPATATRPRVRLGLEQVSRLSRCPHSWPESPPPSEGLGITTTGELPSHPSSHSTSSQGPAPSYQPGLSEHSDLKTLRQAPESNCYLFP